MVQTCFHRHILTRFTPQRRQISFFNNHLPSTPIKRQLFCGGHGKPLLHSDSDTHKFSCLTIENLCRIFECIDAAKHVATSLDSEAIQPGLHGRLVAGSPGQKSLPRSGAAG
jgi:hypothetical protein